MSTNEGARLAQSIREKVEEMKKLCEKLDEGRAGRAPSGRWAPKQILSHLCGPEGVGLMPAVRAILEKDTPRLDLEAENPFFTGKRLTMTFAELLKEFEKEYTQIADFVAGLSAEQLNCKADIPMFKETAMGGYPTLAMFVGALGEYHMDFHINHMKDILQALGAG